MNPYRVAATMVVLLVVAEASSAQFKATADIVHLDVVVTGPNQLFVPMLSADDFEVFEEGVRQKIAFLPLLPFQWILSRVRPPQFR